MLVTPDATVTLIVVWLWIEELGMVIQNAMVYPESLARQDADYSLGDHHYFPLVDVVTPPPVIFCEEAQGQANVVNTLEQLQTGNPGGERREEFF